VGLEMSGAPRALGDMIDAMNHGGKIALLGLFAKPVELDMTAAIFKGLQFKGVYGREMFETWYKMIAMLQSGLDVSPVITHRLPFDRFDEGFAALNAGEACKVVLDLAA
jgi:threonine 3-dehydrogenase